MTCTQNADERPSLLDSLQQMNADHEEYSETVDCQMFIMLPTLCMYIYNYGAIVCVCRTANFFTDGVLVVQSGVVNAAVCCIFTFFTCTKHFFILLESSRMFYWLGIQYMFKCGPGPGRPQVHERVLWSRDYRWAGLISS